jgi:RimJ/RimL family protein N-acetyltransferase
MYVRTVELIELDRDTMCALAQGDLAGAQAHSPIPLSPFFSGEDQRGVWLRRAEQIALEPAEAHWVTRVVWDPDLGKAVGRAGFHGRPDERGMVEIGYETDPQFQRLGYAKAAVAALIEWATLEPEVRVVRASVSPTNEPSLRIVRGFGFVVVAEQWDEEDGLEIVHELDLANPA